jgi:hypothetical protein
MDGWVFVKGFHPSGGLYLKGCLVDGWVFVKKFHPPRALYQKVV